MLTGRIKALISRRPWIGKVTPLPLGGYALQLAAGWEFNSNCQELHGHVAAEFKNTPALIAHTHRRYVKRMED